MKIFSRLFLVFVASCWPALAQTAVGSIVAHSSDIGAAERRTDSAASKSLLAIRAGNKLREEKQFDAALRAYQDAVRLQPEDANAWFYLGMGYVSLDRFEEARSSFRRSVFVAPEDPAKWFGLCLAHYLLGDYGKAIHTCQESVRLDPQQAEGWAWMGLGYARQRQWDRATLCLERAAALGTRNTEAWYTLGIRYARRGQRTQVLRVYRRLQELDPEQASRFFDVAVSPRVKG
jgi:tetratricopeptide (TPR) repeat protein